jgi:hypothetical protein
MDKIICSLEEWDTIFDYFRPNGSSKTWYIKELKQLSRPLMWGEWNLFTESGEMFDKGMMMGQITPKHSDKIEYVSYNEILGRNHLYIINVYSYSFFSDNLDIGFNCISENYLKDIREGKSKIVMLFLYEGYSGSKGNYDLEIIEKWRNDANLPINSIYYVSGNLLCKQIVEEKNLGYQGRPIQYFEPWNKYNENTIIDFKPVNEKNLYLTYNRNPRHHRVQLILNLLKHNIFDRGLISLSELVYETPEDANVEHVDFLKNNSPFVISEGCDLFFNMCCNITKEDYEKTFVSMVTETLVDEGTLFISEKIWKPIMVGHPFIVYGNLGTLKFLKSMGYRTFDKWINEEYDNEPDSGKRCNMITEELVKLSTKTVEELKLIRSEMNEVCDYNQKWYKKLYDEKYGGIDINGDLTKIFEEVWNELKNKNG